MRPCSAVSILALLSLGASCGHRDPVNPSFSISREDANADLRRMREYPVVLSRPVVVFGGLLDPWIGGSRLARDLRRHTGDPRIISVHFPLCWTFEECREKAIAAVDEAFPTEDPLWTLEVDAVGISMGGLVARVAAAPAQNAETTARRLRIRRLFTVSSPHAGAAWAEFPAFHPLVLDMRSDSRLVEMLAIELRTARFELFPYVQLGDSIVGPEHAAPPGEVPWWVSRGACPLPHIAAMLDERIHADIARRLRREPPFTTSPRAPLPTEAGFGSDRVE
jgi:pimeloyl-ACP methyl ester carboxylesterase